MNGQQPSPSNLSAAAPDLLAALKLFLASIQACRDPEFWHHLREARDAANKAIDKANGKA